MNRRGFIRVGAASVGTLALRPFGLLPGLAQSGPDYRALVCVFLFGGNDSNNTIVPMDDASYKSYTSLRGNLALNAGALGAPITSASGTPVAFHGKLTEVASLFSSKELAVVANVGPLVQPLTRAQYQGQQAAVPVNLFSHSDQQLEWQTSVAQGHSPTGWGGRAADYIDARKINSGNFPSFMSMAGNTQLGVGAASQPLAMNPGSSLALSGFTSSNVSQARYKAVTNLLTLPSGVSLVQTANNVLATGVADAAALSSALGKAAPLQTTFPTTGLAAQLKQIAQIMQVQADLGMRRQIFFASLGGFDTHTSEITTHNNLYPQLSQALAAFYNATQELGLAGNVTTFTESDFSRTFQSTSGDGSDHAWGGHHLVLGGAVKGGAIYGAFPAFELGGPDDADTRGRWIPTTSVDQYGATLCRWFGIPDSDLAAVFPNLTNFATNNIGFLG